MKHRALTIAACLVAAACSDSLSPDAFRDARRRWNQTKPASYSFVLEKRCFCSGPTVQIVVTKGVVTSRTDVATGAPAPPNGWYPDIDRIFTQIDSALARGGETRGRYDLLFGFPKEVFIDQFPNLVDDEITVIISSFTPR